MSKALVTLEIQFSKRSCFYRGNMHCPYLRTRENHTKYFCRLFSEDIVTDILETEGCEVLRHINCFTMAKAFDEEKIVYKRWKTSRNIQKAQMLSKEK